MSRRVCSTTWRVASTPTRAAAVLATFSLAALITSFLVEVDIAPGTRWWLALRPGVVQLELSGGGQTFGVVNYRGHSSVYMQFWARRDASVLVRFLPTIFPINPSMYRPSYSRVDCFNNHDLNIPLIWMPLLLSIWPLATVVRTSNRLCHNHCPACGYDLRASSRSICSECGFSTPNKTKEPLMSPSSQPPRRSRLVGLGLLAAAITGTAYLVHARTRPAIPRFDMSAAGDCLFLLDQQTGIVRVFRGDKEARRFDAPLALDEEGHWLDDFENPDPDLDNDEVESADATSDDWGDDW